MDLYGRRIASARWTVMGGGAHETNSAQWSRRVLEVFNMAMQCGPPAAIVRTWLVDDAHDFYEVYPPVIGHSLTQTFIYDEDGTLKVDGEAGDQTFHGEGTHVHDAIAETLVITFTHWRMPRVTSSTLPDPDRPHA